MKKTSQKGGGVLTVILVIAIAVILFFVFKNKGVESPEVIPEAEAPVEEMVDGEVMEEETEAMDDGEAMTDEDAAMEDDAMNDEPEA